jgi:hypothetical protein
VVQTFDGRSGIHDVRARLSSTKASLYHSLFDFTNPEILDDDEMYICDTCSKLHQAAKDAALFALLGSTTTQSLVSSEQPTNAQPTAETASSESHQPSEAAPESTSASETASDAVTVADATSDAINVAEAASDAVTVADAASDAVTVAEAASDAVTVTEAASDAVTVAEAASDAATVTDAASDAVNVAEAASASDTASEGTLDVSSSATSCSSNNNSTASAAPSSLVTSGVGKDVLWVESGDNIKVVATKQLLIHRLPKVLTLALKRFGQSRFVVRTTKRGGGGAGGLAKVDTYVEFPLLLDMRPFLSQELLQRLGSSGFMYKLRGISVHGGGMGGGHYVAYVCKSPGFKVDTESNATTVIGGADSRGSWYYFSDSQSSAVDIESVLAKQAYVLFYERIEQ